MLTLKGYCRLLLLTPLRARGSSGSPVVAIGGGKDHCGRWMVAIQGIVYSRLPSHSKSCNPKHLEGTMLNGIVLDQYFN